MQIRFDGFTLVNQAVHFDEKGLQSNSVCADHGLKPKKGLYLFYLTKRFQTSSNL
jgi:hypothetical protein